MLYNQILVTVAIVLLVFMGHLEKRLAYSLKSGA